MRSLALHPLREGFLIWHRTLVGRGHLRLITAVGSWCLGPTRIIRVRCIVGLLALRYFIAKHAVASQVSFSYISGVVIRGLACILQSLFVGVHVLWLLLEVVAGLVLAGSILGKHAFGGVDLRLASKRTHGGSSKFESLGARLLLCRGEGLLNVGLRKLKSFLRAVISCWVSEQRNLSEFVELVLLIYCLIDSW